MNLRLPFRFWICAYFKWLKDQKARSKIRLTALLWVGHFKMTSEPKRESDLFLSKPLSFVGI